MRSGNVGKSVTMLNCGDRNVQRRQCVTGSAVGVEQMQPCGVSTGNCNGRGNVVVGVVRNRKVSTVTRGR